MILVEKIQSILLSLKEHEIEQQQEEEEGIIEYCNNKNKFDVKRNFDNDLLIDLIVFNFIK